MKTHSVRIVFLSIVLCLAVSAQPAYKKKTVSFVDHVVAPSGLTAQQSDYIAKTMAAGVTMERFNYASLPGSVVKEFIAASSGLTAANAEQIRGTIERTLAPKLMELLDINKEILSKQSLSDAERNSFLATKAQSAGLSAAQLESILNSGFFFVPYVEYFDQSTARGEREVKNDEGKVVRKVPTLTHETRIKAGLLWFQLVVDRTNAASIRFAGAANGWKGMAISRSETRDLDGSGGIEWETFTQAVNTSAVNAGNETKKLEAFMLTGTVTETTTFGVMLSLGRREGVKLDDSYWIEEQEETESGEIVNSRRGFVKVRSVGDNADDASALSYAQTITGSNYSPGLSVKEIPMIGINALAGAGSLPVRISPFDNRASRFGLSKYDFAVRVTGETQRAFGPFVWFQANIANSANISELWFHAGGAVGIASVEGKFYFPTYSNTGGTSLAYTDSADIGLNLTGYVNFGLVKKFYFRRFGLILQADIKYWLTDLTATATDNRNNSLDISLMNDALGFDGRAGVEVYLTPMLSVGAGAEYNLFASDNIWTASVTDKDKNETKNSEAVGPDTRYSGLGVYVWLNYALPSLF